MRNTTNKEIKIKSLATQ